MAGLSGLENVTSADVPGSVAAHERPPVPLGKEVMCHVESAVPNIVVGCNHCLNPVVVVQDSLVGASSVSLPEDVAIYKECGSVMDDKGVLMIGNISRTVEGDEPVVCRL